MSRWPVRLDDAVYNTLVNGILVAVMIRGWISALMGGAGSGDDPDPSAQAGPPAHVHPTSPRSLRESVSNYFAPPPLPFQHTPTSLSQTRILLTRLVPPELVPLILDAAGADLLVAVQARRSGLVVFDDSERGRRGRPAGGDALFGGTVAEGKEWVYLLGPRMPGRVTRVRREVVRPPRAGEDEEDSSTDEDGIEEDRLHTPASPLRERRPCFHQRSSSTVEHSPWRVKQIKISVLSCDQGWTSSPVPADAGEYDHSYTWFDLVVIRPDGLNVGESITIQRNARAVRIPRLHLIELELHHGEIQGIRPGDRLCLLAKAAYIGWQNRVQDAAVTILYGF